MKLPLRRSISVAPPPTDWRAMPEGHLIIRTGWLYGPDPRRRNFALRLVARLRAGETVTVPEDQFGCPTYTEDLARATRWLVDRGHTGTFHATGPDFVSRISLARSICRVFGEADEGVRASPTAALGQAARRSLRVQLSCEKLQATGAPHFRGIEAGLSARCGTVVIRHQLPNCFDWLQHDSLCDRRDNAAAALARRNAAEGAFANSQNSPVLLGA